MDNNKFNSTNNNNNNNYAIPESILSDLCSRFIINVPEEERHDLIRIFFQIEIAHWFYLDFYCSNDEFASSSSASNSSKSSSDSSTSSLSSSSSSSSASSSDSDNDSEDEGAAHNNLVSLKPVGNSSQFSSLPHSHQTPTTTDDSNNINSNSNSNCLKPCSIRVFAENIFRHCPFLTPHSNQVDDILSRWKTFKHAVPTNGAIIMDETLRHVLLVQGFWSKASWGFPKGKVFEEETEAKCAQREVLEETGYDITDRMNADEYFQININEQTIRLYLVTGVSRATKFEPKTRREIREARWFAIDELPVNRKDPRTKPTLGLSPNAFFMVIPFVKALRRWIALKQAAPRGQTVNGWVIEAPVYDATKTTYGLHLTYNPNHHRHHHHKTKRDSHENKNVHVYKHHGSNNRSSHSHFGNNNSNNSTHYQYDSSGPSFSKYNSSINQSSVINGSYKKISKSNENLCVSSKAHISINNSAKKTNSFLKQVTNNANNSLQHVQQFQQYSPMISSNVVIESERKENANVFHYFAKLQCSDYDELIMVKQAALANKTNSFNNNNSNGKNRNNSRTKNQPHTNTATSLSLAARKRTVSLNKDSQMKNDSISPNAKNSVLGKQARAQNVNCSSAIRKQLNFSGPECWINFKFDTDSIMRNLPPLLEL